MSDVVSWLVLIGGVAAIFAGGNELDKMNRSGNDLSMPGPWNYAIPAWIYLTTGSLMTLSFLVVFLQDNKGMVRIVAEFLYGWIK